MTPGTYTKLNAQLLEATRPKYADLFKGFGPRYGDLLKGFEPKHADLLKTVKPIRTDLLKGFERTGFASHVGFQQADIASRLLKDFQPKFADMTASLLKDLRPKYVDAVASAFDGFQPKYADIAALFETLEQAAEPVDEPPSIQWLRQLPTHALLNLLALYIGALLALSLSFEDAAECDIPDPIQNAVGALVATIAAAAATLKRRDSDD